MSNTREDIVGKVRKLLAKTAENGCTQAEADAAFAMASRIMAEHAIEIEEVHNQGDSVEEYAEDEVGDEVARWSSERDWAGMICKRYFFVHVYQKTWRNPTRNRQFFFGTPTNVETAKWVYLALLDAFNRLWRDAKRKHNFPTSDRRTFTLGVVQGFRLKLEDERRAIEVEREVMGKTGSEIVLASADQKREVAFKEAHTDMGKGRSAPAPRGSAGALQAGVAAGRSLNLSRPIGSGEAKAPTRGRLPG